MNQPWKVIFAFVAVFIAGSVFGGFFALRIRQQVVPRGGAEPVLLPPQNLPAIPLLRRFAERLELTDEQREKLRPIVLKAENELNRVREDSMRGSQSILQRVQQEFRAELTPRQRRQLDQMEERQRDIMRQERMRKNQPQPFGPPGGGPGRPFNQNQGPNNPGFGPNNNPPFPNQPGPGQRGPYQPGPNQPPPNQGPQNPLPQSGPGQPGPQPPPPNNPPGPGGN